MDSVQTEEQGRVLYNQLSKLLSKAGMHARKWLSNSPSVLADIPVEDRKAEVDLDSSQLPCTKTDQFRKIIVRYKRIGYNINIMRQSACLVFNPITVNNFASLFNCTPVGRASDSMMAPT